MSLDQVDVIASRFGESSKTTFTYHDIFMELKPKEVPKYTNIMYPFDMWTWAALAMSFATFAATMYAVDAKHSVTILAAKIASIL